MKGIDTRDDELLLVGLYDWCTQMALDEIDSNFDTLARVKSTLAATYVEFMTASGDKAVAKATGLSLVKRFHIHALRLKGESFTDRDQQLIDGFFHFARFKRFGAKTVADGPSTTKIASNDHVFKRLVSFLGKPTLLERNLLRYESAVAPYRILTFVDLGGNVPLRYSHKVTRGDGKILCETSLLHWYGISAETFWDCLAPDEVEAALEILFNACEQFKKAIKNIRREFLKRKN